MGSRGIKGVVVFVALLLVAFPAHAFTLQEVLKEMKRAQEVTFDMSARLAQEKILKGSVNPIIMKGKIKLKKPDKLYMETLPPNRTITVLNGTELLVYFPSEKVAQKFDLSKDPTLAKWLRFLQDPVSEIERAGVLEGEKEGKVILRLDPSGEFDFFKSIRLWVDIRVWLPVQIELVEKNGDLTITTYTDLVTNTGIGDEEFEIKLPPDVEVTEAPPPPAPAER